jgi:diaminopimelate epimerase
MHGAGNDYVYLDCFNDPTPPNPAELAIAVSDRHKGIGADGLIMICPTDGSDSDAQMRMFNADGSEAEMCGNGIRCVAKYLFDHGICEKTVGMLVKTGAGILTLDLTVENSKVSSVTVDMGPPILTASEIPTTFENTPVVNQTINIDGREFVCHCVSMGNPHCVIFVPEANDELVLGIGPKIETAPHFPARVNVEFVEVISRTEVRQRTWERGSGETMACGTGASAVCVAGVLADVTEREITNHLLGGTLNLRWDEATNHVFKTGPATEVYSGTWPSN